MSELRVEEEALEFDDEEFCLWQGERFSGVAFERYPSGQLRSEVEYRNGVKQGAARFWYESGQLRRECVLWNGSAHGASTEWYQEGRLKVMEKFEHGIVVEAKHWNESGELVKEYCMKESDPNYGLVLHFRELYGDAGTRGPRGA